VVAAALAAASLVDVEPAIVVPELLPKVLLGVDELPRLDDPPSADVAGGPPIAVVPVDGVVLAVLPGVVGPASALEVPLPVVEPMLFVPAMLLVVEPGVAVAEPGTLLPSVVEPSVPELCVEGLVVVPQG
jgi:hypothetical protein